MTSRRARLGLDSANLSRRLATARRPATMRRPGARRRRDQGSSGRLRNASGGRPIPSEQHEALGEQHEKLRGLLDQLDDDLATRVFTHASWTPRRSHSYERLAFLGDSVLALAVTAHLYPRLEADRFGAGRLTKIRAQAVSGRSCRAVAERIGVPERLERAAPASAGSNVRALIGTERVLASVIEAVIGACYLAFGYDRTAEAVVQAFAPEIRDALEHPVDYKSALQERLARRGELVSYDVVDEQGPPHDRIYSISATIEGVEVGRGTGRSKKDAEQEAAQAALDALD